MRQAPKNVRLRFLPFCQIVHNSGCLSADAMQVHIHSSGGNQGPSATATGYDLVVVQLSEFAGRKYLAARSAGGNLGLWD